MKPCSKCPAASDKPHCPSGGCGWTVCPQGHITSLFADGKDAAADDAV